MYLLNYMFVISLYTMKSQNLLMLDQTEIAIIVFTFGIKICMVINSF